LTGLTEVLVLALSLTAMRRSFGYLPTLRPVFGAGLALGTACAVHLAESDLSYPVAAAGSLVTYAAIPIALGVVAPRRTWKLAATTLWILRRRLIPTEER